MNDDEISSVERGHMTALNFMLSEDSVMIVTDTIASSPDDLSAIGLVKKHFYLPSKNMVICGTGLFPFINDWISHVNDMDVFVKMSNMDASVTSSLNEIFENHSKQKTNFDLRSTIYHLGFEPSNDCFYGYAFRSKNCFIPEELAMNACGIKPPIENYESIVIANPSFPLQDFIQIIIKQRDENEIKSLDEQVGIGGFVNVFCMSRNPNTKDNLPLLITDECCFCFIDTMDITRKLIYDNIKNMDFTQFLSLMLFGKVQ